MYTYVVLLHFCSLIWIWNNKLSVVNVDALRLRSQPGRSMDADVESKPVEMVSKWPSYFRIGQTRNQETAVQRTFHLERTSFFYLSALTVRTLYFAHSCTKHGPLFLPSGSGARETTSLLTCMTTPPSRFIAQCKHASYPNVKEDLNGPIRVQ